jgi:NADH-quinone oxidoreductase subunit J
MLNFPTILFYIFSLVLIASSFVVVSAKNSIYSVMFLILAFFNASALFVLLGAEYLAILLIVVYVGAIAVLFLFVVMMLNIDNIKIKTIAKRNTTALVMIAFAMFLELFLIINISPFQQFSYQGMNGGDINNIKAIGDVLYTDFIVPFQLSGAILFVAMIGAIALALDDRPKFIRKQENQFLRTKENSLEIIKSK